MTKKVRVSFAMNIDEIKGMRNALTLYIPSLQSKAAKYKNKGKTIKAHMVHGDKERMKNLSSILHKLVEDYGKN